MHLKSTAVLLGLMSTSALAANEQQATLKEKAAGWLDKAKAYVSSAAPSIPNPIDAGAAKVAEYKVEKINIRNYERKLGPKADGEEEWMIYIHGGNKTCHGRCDLADRVWNESVPLLAALEPFSGSTLKLGQLNCEVDEILCTAWAAAVPSIFHFIFPQQTTFPPQPVSPLHDVPVNLSGVAVSDIVSIPRASESRYLSVEEYVGAFHPVDGALRKYGLLNAVGYALWGFSTTPSWLFMILISFVSRQMMARKATQRATLHSTAGMAEPPVGGSANPAAAGVAGANNAPAPGSPAGGKGTGASPAGGKGGKKRK